MTPVLTKLRLLSTSRTLVSFAGLVVLSVLIVAFGPLIRIGSTRPMAEEPLLPFYIIAGLWAVWLLFWGFGWLVRFWKGRRLVSALKDESGDFDPLSDLSGRFDEALDALKTMRFSGQEGSKRLEEMPWYVMLGPPGSGKTTALAQSGLNFPLAERFGDPTVKGGGGTRNCDWMFTEDAVLIDTAGRYTTQDASQERDRSEWLQFIGLLKRHRSREPINGIMVAVGLVDLAVTPEADRQKHARAIASRLNELQLMVGHRLPIYVLFTKLDLVAGFIEFFDDLSREEREQVWGVTLPMDDGSGDFDPIEKFAEEFDELVRRIAGRTLDRMNEATDSERRGRLFGFPAELASLREIARTFLHDALRPNRYAKPPLLRGVYLTSGTQQGSPIDRVLAAMGRRFGVAAERPPAFRGAGRSFFLKRLMTEVIFREAHLLTRLRDHGRPGRIAYGLGWLLAVLMVVLVAGSWALVLERSQEEINDVRKRVETFRNTYADFGKTPMVEPDYATAIKPLHDLAFMPFGYLKPPTTGDLLTGLGLYQGPELNAALVKEYRAMLNRVLLPVVGLDLELAISANVAESTVVLPLVKLYLMLGGEEKLDPAAISSWVDQSLLERYPGQENQPFRNAILAHLQVMLEDPGKLDVNDNLIDIVEEGLERQLK